MDFAITTGAGAAYHTGAGSMFSTTGARVAHTACAVGAAALYSSTGAGVAYTTGAGEMYSPTVLVPRTQLAQSTCTQRQVQVRRPLQAHARCTLVHDELNDRCGCSLPNWRRRDELNHGCWCRIGCRHWRNCTHPWAHVPQTSLAQACSTRKQVLAQPPQLSQA